MKLKVFFARNDSGSLETMFNEWMETGEVESIYKIEVVASGRIDHNVTMTIFYYPTNDE